MSTKFLIVFGTRPELIKLYPVMKELEDFKILFTGQHKETLDFLGIRPDFSLEVLQKNQTLNELSAKLFVGIDTALRNINPEFVIVQGDTTSAYVAAVCAYNLKIKVIHIEAGLRTYDMWNPYPEEFNRVSIDKISSILFAPSKYVKLTLEQELKFDSDIYVSGNTVIDSCLEFCDIEKKSDYLLDDFVLVTMHRRENFGDYVYQVISEIKSFSEYTGQKFLIMNHPNGILEKCYSLFNDKMKLLSPIGYLDFLDLINNSRFIVTDSGGLQEEASVLNKISLCMRERTERVELVKEGYSFLIGNSMERFRNYLNKVYNRDIYLQKDISEHPYYVAGGSGKFICDTLKGL